MLWFEKGAKHQLLAHFFMGKGLDVYRKTR